MFNATSSASLNLNTNNVADCIKTINRFNDSVYVNICNGTQTTVPTGSFDWFMFWIGCAFAFVILAFITTALFKFWFD